MLDIDKVIYINLEHRKDRKDHVERELLKVFPSQKIVRFDAIKDNHGGIGCTKSHIAVLKMAIENNWKNYLVVEDDMMWSNLNTGIQLLNDFLSKQYDVIILGGAYVKLKEEYKVLEAYTTTAYIVSNNYYSTLLSNFEEGLQKFIQTNEYNKYAIDKYWRPLQKEDTWYIILPSMCIQRPDYSDIEKHYVDYTPYFKET